MSTDFSVLDPVLAELKSALAERGFWPFELVNPRFLRLGRPGFVAIPQDGMAVDPLMPWRRAVIARSIVVGGSKVRACPERIRVTAAVEWHPRAMEAVTQAAQRWQKRIVISSTVQSEHRCRCCWDPIGPDDMIP